MKFLSDLGSCYRPSAQARRQQPEGPDKSVQVVLLTSGCNETWSKQRRKKMNVSKYWRPELSVISEDRVVSFLEIDQGKDHHHQCEQKVSSKSKTRSTAKSPLSSCYDKNDYYEYYPRKISTPMLIPVFSPTPFMF